MNELPVPRDKVLERLDELVRVLHTNRERNEQAIARADRIRTQRLEGRSYREIVAAEEGPLIAELATQSIDALVHAAGRFRRAEAEALHREGLTMDRIAHLFGVTRQRVSVLLRSRAPAA